MLGVSYNLIRSPHQERQQQQQRRGTLDGLRSQLGEGGVGSKVWGGVGGNNNNNGVGPWTGCGANLVREVWEPGVGSEGVCQPVDGDGSI
jgi:hypothetical protein